MNIDLKTWIISDTHWGHENIIRYCSRPLNHDKLMLLNWHATVERNETILHLGDLVGRNPSNELLDQIKKLAGKKYLIKGNHDTRPNSFYEDLGFEIVPIIHMDIDDYTVALTHYPIMTMVGNVVNIHGHIHNNGYPAAFDREKDYRNVSVEINGYKPVTLWSILYDNAYQPIKMAKVSP